MILSYKVLIVFSEVLNDLKMISMMQTKFCSTGKFRTVLLKEVKNKHIGTASFISVSNRPIALKTLTSVYFTNYPKILSALNLLKREQLKLLMLLNFQLYLTTLKYNRFLRRTMIILLQRTTMLGLRFRTDTGNILEPTLYRQP